MLARHGFCPCVGALLSARWCAGEFLSRRNKGTVFFPAKVLMSTTFRSRARASSRFLAHFSLFFFFLPTVTDFLLEFYFLNFEGGSRVLCCGSEC